MIEAPSFTVDYIRRWKFVNSIPKMMKSWIRSAVVNYTVCKSFGAYAMSMWCRQYIFRQICIFNCQLYSIQTNIFAAIYGTIYNVNGIVCVFFFGILSGWKIFCYWIFRENSFAKTFEFIFRILYDSQAMTKMKDSTHKTTPSHR